MGSGYGVRFVMGIGRGDVRDETGQDLIEYGLLAALVVVFSIGAVTLLGNQINTVFWQLIANSL